MKTLKELYKELRQRANIDINNRGKYTGGSNYMRDRLQIFNENKLYINENSIYETLIRLSKEIPFEEMAKIQLNDRYFLVTDAENPSSKYKAAKGGWWVISNFPVVRVATALNELFDRLENRFIAKITERK